MEDLEPKMLREDLDSLTDVVKIMSDTVLKLEKDDKYANLTTLKHGTAEAREFVRKELIDIYSDALNRDQIPLEYVIRQVSTADQWADFYYINQLKYLFAIGEGE